MWSTKKRTCPRPTRGERGLAAEGKGTQLMAGMVKKKNRQQPERKGSKGRDGISRRGFSGKGKVSEERDPSKRKEEQRFIYGLPVTMKPPL